MKIPTLISTGMVLQRDRENTIWGEVSPGSTLKLSLCEGDGAPLVSVWGEVAANGSFSAVLPPREAGRGLMLVLEEYADGECLAKQRITDVAIGDVFLLSGQSNMELPVSRTLDVTGEVISQCDYPYIREFDVPQEYDFRAPRSKLSGGVWKNAQGEALMSFSGAGFFMAKSLYEKLDVPIGLVQTAVGGTPVRAWCSESTIAELGDFAPELALCRKPGYIEEVQQNDLRMQADWMARADRFDDIEPSEVSGNIEIPGLWRGTELAMFTGSILIERDFELDYIGDTAFCYLGALIDSDRVYINGKLVGETGYRYPPRKYPFDPSCLRLGTNHIRVEMFVSGTSGGFMPTKPYYVETGRAKADLSGTWSYKVVRRLAPMQEQTFFQYKATGLYNAMLSPIARYAFRGMAWYQGESDTGMPWIYGKYFHHAVNDWRDLFGKNLPIVTVELAEYEDIDAPSNDGYEMLRKVQRDCAQMPGVGIVSAYDIGEPYDLHPQDKLHLGERLADAMLELAY